VIFRHPAEFVTVSDEDGILAAEGARWFVELLGRVPGLEVEDDLCQEDWGVVLFARFEQKPFWIGLSFWSEGENAWLAHVHHGGWLQRFRGSGKSAFERLLSSVHAALVSEPAASEITWFEQRQLTEAHPVGFKGPVGA
jgi:hypothetical protein